MLKHLGVSCVPLVASDQRSSGRAAGGEKHPKSEGGWSERLASGGIIYAIYRAYSERGMHQLWLLYRHQLYTHNTIYQY